MPFSSSNFFLAMASSLLQLAVCVLAWRRRLYLRLPLFTAYLTLLLVRTLFLWVLYLSVGYDSPLSFQGYWVSQGILLAARGVAVAEIAWRAVREYRGVWALGWRLLCGIALLLLVHAAVDARGAASWIAPFLLTAERDLELAVLGILVVLLTLCRYYGIRLEPVQKMVALGMGFYSAIQSLNNSFVQDWLARYFTAWSAVRVFSFEVTLVIWLVALRRPLPAAAPAPVLLPQKLYDELSPQVNNRLRVLNQRLLEILKP